MRETSSSQSLFLQDHSRLNLKTSSLSATTTTIARLVIMDLDPGNTSLSSSSMSFCFFCYSQQGKTRLFGFGTCETCWDALVPPCLSCKRAVNEINGIAVPGGNDYGSLGVCCKDQKVCSVSATPLWDRNFAVSTLNGQFDVICQSCLVYVEYDSFKKGSYAPLVDALLPPWSKSTHGLFPERVRTNVKTLLMVGAKLKGGWKDVIGLLIQRYGQAEWVHLYELALERSKHSPSKASLCPRIRAPTNPKFNK